MTQLHKDSIKTLILALIGFVVGMLDKLLMLNVRTDCDSIEIGHAFRLFADNKLSLLKKTHIYTPNRILMHGYARIIEHNTELTENKKVSSTTNIRNDIIRKTIRYNLVVACRKYFQYLDGDICREWLNMQLIIDIDDERPLIIRKCDAELKGLSMQIDELIVKNNKETETSEKRVTYYDYLKEFQIVTEKRTMSLKEPYSSYIVAQNLFYAEIEAKNKQIELNKNGRARNNR